MEKMQIKSITDDGFRLPHKATRYGREEQTVWIQGARRDVSELKLEYLQFELPDNKLGIRAVAAALGFGMDAVCLDECEEGYKEFGYGVNRNDLICFEEPVILYSYNLHGFAGGLGGLFGAVWGGGKTALLKKIVVTDCKYAPDRSIDVYKLHLNLPNGGFLLQRCYDLVIIRAEKVANHWLVTLISPKGANTHGYESLFYGACNWYEKQSQGIRNTHLPDFYDEVGYHYADRNRFRNYFADGEEE